jgi:hypothetical protein
MFTTKTSLRLASVKPAKDKQAKAVRQSRRKQTKHPQIAPITTD